MIKYNHNCLPLYTILAHCVPYNDVTLRTRYFKIIKKPFEPFLASVLSAIKIKKIKKV